MADATGIWILVVDACPLVSMPGNALDRVGRRATTWSRTLVADPDALAAELKGLDVQKIVGPAFIGYGTEESLDLSASDEARSLVPSDHPAVAGLRERCGDEEWDHGGSDPEAVPTSGSFDDQGELMALSGYKTWGGEIAHIAIVSAAEGRSQGHASRAVARAARHALDAGLLPQYRTLAANAPSMRLAEKLGFQSYGFSVFVRLGTA